MDQPTASPLRREYASLASDTRGGVFVETLIGYLPVLWFFVLIWQLCELMAADVVMRRAASAAARAASVVLPDDPQFYTEGASKKSDIERAAKLIAKAAPQLSEITVSYDAPPDPPGAPPETISVKVSAEFRCFGGWLSVVCAGNTRHLERSANYAYQGAKFEY